MPEKSVNGVFSLAYSLTYREGTDTEALDATPQLIPYQILRLLDKVDEFLDVLLLTFKCSSRIFMSLQ